MLFALFPFLLLITAIGSVLWYKKTDNDIFAALAVSVAVVCLIWVLLLAHWTINLFALVLLLKFQNPVLRSIKVDIGK
jgi:Na+/proline symporter